MFKVRPKMDISPRVEIVFEEGTYNPRPLDKENCGIQGAPSPGLIYLQIH
jgi:hypothetical protein